MYGNWPELPRYNWRSEAETIVVALCRWFPDAFTDDGEDLPDEPLFVHFFAGLAALADWVGSDRRFFEFVPEFDLKYDRMSRDRAAKVLTEVGLDVRHLPRRPSLSFAELTNFARPNPAQDVVGKLKSDERLAILEAETGSGKTEAALWRFAQLFSAGCVEGLYFAVPTRAAARQLHGRVNEAMQRVFGTHAPEAVLAIPGMLTAGAAHGQRLPGWKVLWEDRKDTVPARWAAEHATRFLAATVAGGTVDQAMLAGLMVKHAHLRGSSLSRSLLVIDEVHASDSYMTAVLRHLLNAHLAVEGYAMLMSATLGSRARVRWTGEAQPGFDAAVDTPYPAVWTGGETTPRAAGGVGRSKTVHLRLDDMAPQRTAPLALEAAEQGARVLVIRNTVTMAVQTWRAVQEAGGEAKLLQVAGGSALHHSRFAAEDRQLLDEAVEEALAPDRSRTPIDRARRVSFLLLFWFPRTCRDRPSVIPSKDGTSVTGRALASTNTSTISNTRCPASTGCSSTCTAAAPGVRYPNETGRVDRYIRPYQGKEYGDDPREVITMAYQYVWQRDRRKPGDGGWWKGKRGLLTHDPEMLDLALGALFKYDP